MKNLLLILIAFGLGCQTNFNQESTMRNSSAKPENNQSESVKVLITHPEGPYLMEINSVPPPFDVAGNFPYVLWVNGKHIPRPPYKDLNEIVAKVGKDNIPPIDPKDIHKGWIVPHYAKIEDSKNLGRTRSLKENKE
jgi:hypothetical protein